MKICGIQKTSLVDYPGHMATVIFTGGCNFNCPYCHNSQLIGDEAEAICTVGDALKMLESRKNLIDAVVISGGEPTLQPDLHAFISKLKSMGFKVKLDTNGSNPDVLKKLIEDGLLDYVAMDVKQWRGWYGAYLGAVDNKSMKQLIDNVDTSIKYLLTGMIPYEFRTTAVRGLHELSDFVKIGKWIEGAENYYIQNYRESESVPAKEWLDSFTEAQLIGVAECVRPYVKNVYSRGI